MRENKQLVTSCSASCGRLETCSSSRSGTSKWSSPAEEHGPGQRGAAEAVAHRVDGGVQRTVDVAVEPQRELQRTIVAEVGDGHTDERE